jgi:hypothetical protein
MEFTSIPPSVTWGVNPFSKWNFAQVPRDINNDPSAGFVALDNLCAVQGGEFTINLHKAFFSAPFPGYRFWVPNDPSLVLIYDVNGYIAGMQTMVSRMCILF